MVKTALAVAGLLALTACDAETLTPCGLQGDLLVCGSETVGQCHAETRPRYTEETGSCFWWNGLCCE